MRILRASISRGATAASSDDFATARNVRQARANATCKRYVSDETEKANEAQTRSSISKNVHTCRSRGSGTSHNRRNDGCRANGGETNRKSDRGVVLKSRAVDEIAIECEDCGCDACVALYLDSPAGGPLQSHIGIKRLCSDTNESQANKIISDLTTTVSSASSCRCTESRSGSLESLKHEISVYHAYRHINQGLK